MADPAIRAVVHEALTQSGAALIATWDFDPAAHASYIEQIERRFENPHIHDENARVGREPLRKLKAGDRLLGPVESCREKGLERGALLKGIAAALRFHSEEDAESWELSERIEGGGVGRVLGELTGWKDSDPDYICVLDFYGQIFRK